MVAPVLLASVTPKVFLSSTIIDLRDLRSAIRYFLQEYGYEVHASEYPDFPQPADREAWRAGMEVIPHSDYYILLIGEWYGYVPEDEISVTHHELRRAREALRQSGKPRMLVLVRRSVHDAIAESRKLEGTDNWDGIAALYAEATRADRPTDANWRVPFSAFGEVASALRATLGIRGSLRRKALEASLIAECERNAARLLLTFGDGVVPTFELLPHRELPAVARDATYPLEADLLDPVKMLLALADRAANLQSAMLREALASGEFLAFDPARGTMVATDELTLLEKLLDRMNRLQDLRTWVRSPQITSEWARLQRTGTEVPVSQDLALAAFSFRDELENVGRLLIAVHRSLRTGVVGAQPAMHPPTPIVGEAERIERETITPDQARAWLELESTRAPGAAGEPSNDAP